MTPEQNLLIRQFYTSVAQDETLFAGKNTSQRSVIGACMDLLGYVVLKGKYVPIEEVKKATPTYGQPIEYECSWEKDTKAVEELVNEANKNNSAIEADSGEPSEDTPVREALFSQDV